MRKVIVVNGYRSGNAALPVINVSEQERRLASLPGLKFWLEPGADYISATSLIERVAGGKLDIRNPNSPSWELGEFANGAPAFHAETSSSAIYAAPPGVEVNKDAWTFVCVLNNDPATQGVNGDEIIAAPMASDWGGLNIRIGIGKDTKVFSVFEGAPAIRLSYEDTSVYVDNTALMMVTFSVDLGLRIFANGEQVAVNAADTRPLDSGLWHLGQQSDSSAGSAAYSGLLGHVALFDVDLSAPAYSFHRKYLETFLLEHYGITP